MSMNFKSASIFCGVCAGIIANSTAVSAVIDSFSIASIKAPITGYPTFAYDANLSGGAASVVRGGIGENFTTVQIYDTGAMADLSTGELKAKSSLMLLPGMYYQNVIDAGPGQGKIGVYGNAKLADSFRADSTNSSFAWGQTPVSFHVDVEGYRNDNGLVIPNANPYTNDHVSFNSILASIVFTAFKPGTLDTLYRLSTDENMPFQEFTSSLNFVNNNTIYSDRVGITPASYGMTWSKESGLPGSFDFTFMPESDFDWIIELDVEINIDQTTTGVMPTFNLFDTVDVSYIGPAGVTTYSGSGVFPGTVPFAATAIPEPSSMLLFAAGLAAITRQCRLKSHKHQHIQAS